MPFVAAHSLGIDCWRDVGIGSVVGAPTIQDDHDDGGVIQMGTVECVPVCYACLNVRDCLAPQFKKARKRE